MAEINLDDWKWLRRIEGTDTECYDYYKELARKNEAMIVAINGEYAYNIYIPEKAVGSTPSEKPTDEHKAVPLASPDTQIELDDIRIKIHVPVVEKVRPDKVPPYPIRENILHIPLSEEAKAQIEALISKRVLEGQVAELRKWHTMIKRLSAYVDSPDSLTEYEERIATLTKSLEEL